MKILINEDNQYYLCDDIENKKGQSRIVPDYEPSPTTMPHKQFNKPKDIVMYAKPDCPYCIGFVQFLKDNNKTTHFYDHLIYIEVNTRNKNHVFSKENILANLKEEIGTHDTFPIVFYNNEFIGGADDSEKYFSNL